MSDTVSPRESKCGRPRYRSRLLFRCYPRSRAKCIRSRLGVLATWRPDYSTLVVAPRGGHGAPCSTLVLVVARVDGEEGGADVLVTTIFRVSAH
jgi:hypothetical protein